MCADRALEGSRLADIGVAAVPADPHLLFLTGKDLALLEVGGKGAVTCLVLLFDLAHHREESGQLGEALLLGLCCHAGVHIGPLFVLAGSGSCEVLGGGTNLAALEVLEPKLGMLALVAGSLGEDVGNADVAVLLGLRGKIGLLVGGHRLSGKGGLKVLLGLRALEIHDSSSLSFLSGVTAALEGLYHALRAMKRDSQTIDTLFVEACRAAYRAFHSPCSSRVQKPSFARSVRMS